MMANSTHELLELRAIREGVSLYAKSAEAQKIILQEEPLFSFTEWRKLREDVEYISARLKEDGNEPSGFIPDINEVIPKLSVEGITLNIEEVFALGIFFKEGNAILKYLLKPVNSEIENIESEIFKIIDTEGAIRDLPSLCEIRKRITNLERDLQNTLKKYCTETETQSLLQSTLPTEKDGRSVLALKANHRGKIKGIVREASATGQTLFIEPLDIVEKNNALLIEKNNYEIEIRRILNELTKKIAEKESIIITFHDEIIKIEVCRAKAKYGLAHNSNFALISKDKSIILKKARHPLLGANAVPIDFQMEDAINTLVITGPNTGGKTVALKTAGLLSLMNQMALAIPAEEGSALPFFDAVFADIGDEQSIEGSLSTFSAHIKNVSFIANNASGGSLVLLDELGSGTDPLEGGALAMAIADFFTEKKIKTIITTHHGVLKNYAYTHKNVENASVEFDETSLSPTYRIIRGIPGESRALLIAEKNLLPKTIIKAAHDYAESGSADVSLLIKTLNEKLQNAENIKKETEMGRRALHNEKRALDLQVLRTRQKEAELKTIEKRAASSFIIDARRNLENLVKELREGEITREKTLKVKQFISDLEAEIENKNELNENDIAENSNQYETENNNNNTIVAVNELKEGDTVFAGDKKLRGVIKQKTKKGFLVTIGSLSLNFSEDEVSPAPSNKNHSHSVSVELEDGKYASFELNLRGLRTAEALDILRSQVDNALISGMREFAVIHGKGDGLLSRAVHDYLKTRREVASFKFSRPELGGYGRTEVVLAPN